MSDGRPTLREAQTARARHEGFVQAVEMMDALSDVGLTPGAIGAAMAVQQRELDDLARSAEAAIAAAPKKPKPTPRPTVAASSEA